MLASLAGGAGVAPGSRQPICTPNVLTIQVRHSRDGGGSRGWRWTRKIAIYVGDHMPPHFHNEGRAFRAVVEIDTLRVRAGNTRHVPEVLTWASENLDLLCRERHRLNRRT